MVWFAALIIVVLTAPIWLGLAVAAGGVALLLMVLILAAAIPAVIGGYLAAHFGYPSETGAVWGFLSGLLAFALWRDSNISKERNRSEGHQRGFVDATKSHATEVPGLEQLQKDIAKHEAARAAREAEERANLLHRQMIWQQLKPEVGAGIQLVNTILSESRLPVLVQTAQFGSEDDDDDDQGTQKDSYSGRWELTHRYRRHAVRVSYDEDGKIWIVSVREALPIAVTEATRSKIADAVATVMRGQVASMLSFREETEAPF